MDRVRVVSAGRNGRLDRMVSKSRSWTRRDRRAGTRGGCDGAAGTVRLGSCAPRTQTQHVVPDDAQTWIDRLTLEAHPEGGYYRETYRADTHIPEAALPDRFEGGRDAAALIYFLLPGDAFSALHRIRQDEAWHFYAGAPLTLHQIAPDGTRTTCTLGRAVDEGHRLHTVVPAGTWFGAAVAVDDGYALAGCTTAPAFDFADFELADRTALTTEYPQHRALIEQLTRSD